MKLFEYMAAGKAIVATRAGQVVEILHDGESGLLIPPGDVRALTAALHTLLADAPLRARLGAAARHAAESHTWARYVERLDGVYRFALEHPRLRR